MKSPQIEKIEWGEMIVAGLGSGRDFKLYCGGGREWDWSETNTHHNPGIQIADVRELLDAGVKIVVLSRGMQLVLRTCPDVFEHLRHRDVRFFVEETRAAAKIYNDRGAGVTRDDCHPLRGSQGTHAHYCRLVPSARLPAYRAAVADQIGLQSPLPLETFVEVVLAWELGDRVQGDPAFAGIVKTVASRIAERPQLCGRLHELLVSLVQSA